MATSTPNYDVNYDDKRFTQVETDKKVALSEVEKTYGGMVDNVDKFYQAQIDASNQWADKQSQLQQERTDFAIEQINQQKDQAKKDYTKEQSGAYVDWQKQSNQYGANAEQMAGSGLTNSGFSESSQVSMYNTYQNRVATAREVYNRAILNYDNAIKDAQLQNNSALAEIAYNALQAELELSLEGFQYKNNLIIEQSNKKMEIDNMYYGRYQDVLQQINQENALAEEVRQYNLNYDMKVKEYEEGIRQFNEEIARLKANDEKEHALEIQKLELQRDQLEEEQRQFNATHANNSSGGSGGGSGSSGSSGGNNTNKVKQINTGVLKTNTSPNVEVKGMPDKPTTYKAAVNYMKTFGVDGATASNVMTESEWKRRKASYNSTGTGNAAVKANSSYKEYIQDFCAFAIANK